MQEIVINSIVGCMFSVAVFSHKLKIDDAFIGIISSVSKILASLVSAFAVTEWQFYLGKGSLDQTFQATLNENRSSYSSISRNF